MYDIHIRPTGPNGNRGKLILVFVYGSRFTIVFQVARRCASASMSANGIAGQSTRRLPSGYWVPFTVRAIRARRTTLISGMRRMCPIYRNLRCRIARTRCWGCGCVPIVLASDDMQVSAVESVDTRSLRRQDSTQRYEELFKPSLRQPLEWFA